MFPEPYVQYLVHYHGDRDYFECHEILEEYWKETEPRNKESIWVAFIQLAVSSYHYRRSNFAGALRTLDKALSIFSVEIARCRELGIDHYKLMQSLVERRNAIRRQFPYKSMNLPIVDKPLLQKCHIVCKKQGAIWGEEILLDQSLINKHTMRDRTDVILERKVALETRKKEKGCD